MMLLASALRPSRLTVSELAKRVAARRIAARRMDIEGRPVQLTVSVGVYNLDAYRLENPDDALRRAESERERKRGGVPGLHAKPVAMPSPDAMSGLVV